MSRPKALNNSFTVEIDGTQYHYGRHPESGNWLIEHPSDAKDYWSFETEQQMLDFIELLPCSAESASGKPGWLPDPKRSALSDEALSAYIAERLKLRSILAAAKRRNEITSDEVRTALRQLYKKHTG